MELECMCNGCQFNDNNLLCNGFIMHDGTKMSIVNMKKDMFCGIKERGIVYDTTINRKTDRERITDLESKLDNLENQLKTLVDNLS